jgi:hypothetical protein
MSEQLSTAPTPTFDYDAWKAGMRTREEAQRRSAERQLDTEELHRQLGRTGLRRLLRPIKSGRIITTVFNRQRKGEYDPLAAQKETQARADDPLYEESILDRMRRERAQQNSHEVISEDDSGYRLRPGDNPFASKEDDALIEARIAAEAAERATPGRNPFVDE